MPHQDFDRESGTFTCSHSGLYSVSMTSLMKCDSSQNVRLSLQTEKGSSPRETLVTSALGLARQSRSTRNSDVVVDIGISNSIVAPMKMDKGQKVKNPT
jgi:hypothetical protein